ncbi:MAG: peptidase M48 [Verrucomicrobia bacterium]|nr:MAG: peptidase M48 [Verrucomicrobiota bacterium]PYL41966.1 MAG: peptidase M48 [Verrucomicrobiota bacterium]
MQPFAIVALVLILARAIAELWLSRLNQHHVRAHANELPPAFRGIIDKATYRRSVDYTLAKSHFADITGVFDVVVLIAVLFSGVLPWAFGRFTATFGTSIWAMASFLFFIGIGLSILALPFAWYAQFKLEERFGFNTTTMKTWVLDRVKGFLLAVLLGYPLLALVLKLIEWTGASWWLWAAAVVIAFQLLLLLIAPAIIMPLFNKFTPLSEGALRQRLFALAQRTGFPTRSIDVMDGSKRSRHSNAFFTGFGRFRKIVLFDTLIAQLSEPELESVLAHEIGHYKKRHVVKLLGFSIAGVFVAFAAIASLARQEWFYRAFGFEHQGGFAAGNVVVAMLLFGLLAGTISFWLSPFIHILSRRFEYEADAFARATMREAQSLIQALRKLSEKNLSNLNPHPLYSCFYYSHPTLLERERALRIAV